MSSPAAGRERPLSPSEVAGELGISPKTVRRLCRRGEIACYRLGALWFIEPAELRRIRAQGMRDVDA